jgi:hypothetical protein
MDTAQRETAALDAAAKQYAAEHDTDYPTAVAAVAKRDPALWQRYLAESRGR